jgi:coenzyme F420 biosynthesis associated uncharacterized protein
MWRMTNSEAITVGRAVDWDFAGSLGSWLARPGGPVTEYTRNQAIAELARAAVAAEGPVRDVTRLDPGRSVPEARVVNRQEWVRAAAHSMRTMTGGSDKPSNFIAGRVTGAQTGAVLAFISSGILGQYDPFAGAPNHDGDESDSAGELLLVYPNVIAVERELRVSPSDFRMWVCLHEVTHRVQFTANPWLTGHMSSALQTLTSDGTEDVTEVVSRLADFVKERRQGTRGATAHAEDSGILGFLRIFQTPAQRAALDQLLVLGTLLEGHADYVMDAVGPAVVPSVESIRRRFDKRRQRRQPPIQRLLRALLGFEAKMNQYTRGKAFVEQVVDRVGIERFNVVWSAPDSLPLPVEIDNPQQWIDRVL